MKEDEYKADILASQAGDTEALNRLWVAAVPLCYRVATDYVKHYEWIDHDDLAMNLVERVPHFVASFKVDHASTTDLWKYLFFRLRFYAKDVLRKEDPLGISHPQKQMYPQWSRLGDEALDNFDPYAADINWEALDAILDGEVPNEAIRATLQQIAPERFNKKGSVWAKKAKRLRKIRKLKRPRPTKKRSLKFFLDQKKEIKKNVRTTHIAE